MTDLDRGPCTGSDIRDLLEARGVLVADGGMGTSLFAMGLTSGQTPELWNVEHPDRVAAVHQGFVDAGSDVILTNTFGGTRTRLALDRLEDRVVELNSAAVQIACDVARRASRPVVVAGSVGPTGSLFEPLGELTIRAGTEIFSEQIEVLATAGADVLWIETLSSVDELRAAVAAAIPTNLPIVTTMSFDTHGRTMMGVPPADLAGWWAGEATTPVAMGANCGVGPGDVVQAVAEIRTADPDIAIVAKANCGIPEIIDGTLWYPTANDDMTDYAELALDAGARIIGACCGSVPEHLRQIRKTVDEYVPGPAPTPDDIAARLGGVSRPAEAGAGRSRRRRRAGV